MPALQRIAFFGATGGCANAALVLALQAGYPCSALARTPSKLHAMLLAAGVTEAQLAAQLVIVRGDGTDADAVLATLAPRLTSFADGVLSPASDTTTPTTTKTTTTTTITNNTTDTTTSSAYPFDAAAASVATVAISGIGQYPTSRDFDPRVCRTAAAALVAAAARLPIVRRPVVLAISTTGITTVGPRDVPLLCVPLYHMLLTKPHADKRAMEDILGRAAEEGKVKAVCVVRASLLTDGAEQPREAVRVGTEMKPAVGYTIARKDVGRWIFEEAVRGDVRAWTAEPVTLTY